MGLTDFFRINFPYGIKRNDKGKWIAFNREYVPLGWNTTFSQQSIAGDFYSEFPVYTKYNALTEAKLLKLAHGEVSRDDNGKINTVFFYNDSTNPQSNPKHWDSYFERIKLLASLIVKI